MESHMGWDHDWCTDFYLKYFLQSCAWQVGIDRNSKVCCNLYASRAEKYTRGLSDGVKGLNEQDWHSQEGNMPTLWMPQRTSNYKWWQWLLHPSCQASHFLLWLRVRAALSSLRENRSLNYNLKVRNTAYIDTTYMCLELNTFMCEGSSPFVGLAF